MKKNVKMKIAFGLLIFIYANFIIAQNLEKTNGTITGTVKTQGVIDAGDVVVFLEKVEGVFKAAEENPVMDQKDLMFSPHVLPVLVGTTVKFPNSDNVRHSICSPSKAIKINLGAYSPGDVREVVFDQPGVFVLLCNIHKEMSALIVVLENPYFVITKPDGKFTINNVPSGTYKIKTWHEKLKEKKHDVTVTEGGIVSIDFKLSR